MEYFPEKFSTRRKVIFGMKTQKTWIDRFELLLKFGNMANSVTLKFERKVQVRAKLGVEYTTKMMFSLPVFGEVDVLTFYFHHLSAVWIVVTELGQFILVRVVKLDYYFKRKFGEAHTSKKYKALSRFVNIVGIVSVVYPILGALPQQIKDRYHRQYWGSQLLPR
ncbi:hypothetical protein Fcan01_16009 [Folsomia candida]|uniref:Uncharacterized protein n=1 Tax=Folsomia candida TaxID=158441 RepID=A0A226DWF9_FOLCA|nr:hypothetical protein Fcan01_16009 [Folsomia candida]